MKNNENNIWYGFGEPHLDLKQLYKTSESRVCPVRDMFEVLGTLAKISAIIIKSKNDIMRG